MPTMNPLQKPINPKYALYVCFGILIALGLLHFFILQVVYPRIVGSLDVYIPAKTGGKNYLVGVDQFTAISTIALVAAVVITGIVSLLVRFKKTNAIVMATCGFIILAGMFMAIFIGNAFHALWGMPWAVAGVITVVVVGTALEFPLLMSIDNKMNQRKRQ